MLGKHIWRSLARYTHDRRGRVVGKHNDVVSHAIRAFGWSAWWVSVMAQSRALYTRSEARMVGAYIITESDTNRTLEDGPGGHSRLRTEKKLATRAQTCRLYPFGLIDLGQCECRV